MGFKSRREYVQLHGGYRKDVFGKTRRKAGSNEGKGGTGDTGK